MVNRLKQFVKESPDVDIDQALNFMPLLFFQTKRRLTILETAYLYKEYELVEYMLNRGWSMFEPATVYICELAFQNRNIVNFLVSLTKQEDLELENLVWLVEKGGLKYTSHGYILVKLLVQSKKFSLLERFVNHYSFDLVLRYQALESLSSPYGSWKKVLYL